MLSCDKQDLFVSCKDCLDKEPIEVVIDIKLDPFEAWNYTPEISIYEGNMEDSLLMSRYSADHSPISLSVRVNKKYTVVAKYYKYGIYYYAVDAAMPRVRVENEICEKPCYILYDNKVDLRIRYTQ
jgi:hypothetical protein